MENLSGVLFTDNLATPTFQPEYVVIFRFPKNIFITVIHNQLLRASLGSKIITAPGVVPMQHGFASPVAHVPTLRGNKEELQVYHPIST
jgi:hypothetical protein